MISFGAKIPIAKCKIQNRETGQFENATVFEYTCTDKSDVEKIKRIIAKQDWEFGVDIYSDADWKNFASTFDKNSQNTHFYSLENKRRRTIGLCETTENENITVELLETKQSNTYRFVGQTILSTLAKKAFSKSSPLVIQNAIPKALDFYRKTCGFNQEIKDGDDISFIVDKAQLQFFINQTNQRTNGELINLSV